jgi:hypothetical protein
MTRSTLATALLVAGLTLAGILGAAACTREVEVIREVPKEVIKEVIKEVPREVIREVIREVPTEVTKEVPMNLPVTAQAIQKGEIDVGEAFGMELGKRFHTIHPAKLGFQCETCHISSYASDYIYQRKYKVPVRGAPGPVDRGACLACHKETGPAETKLYGTAGK